MCSPSIGDECGDERCIFTCSILFSMKEIFKSEVGLKKVKWDQKD